MTPFRLSPLATRLLPASLLLALLLPPPVAAQPTPTPTNVPLIVNKTTGVIAGPISAANFASANSLGGGGGGGSGTVTSFSAGDLSPLFTTTETNATTTPALAFSLSNAAQNAVFAGPSTGGTGAPIYRALVAADIPSLTLSKISDAGQLVTWAVITPSANVQSFLSSADYAAMRTNMSVPALSELAENNVSGVNTDGLVHWTQLVGVPAGFADGSDDGSGGGSGTVTATAGNLTSNAVVLGAGGVDTKVSTGITSDGTAGLVLGVNATTAGSIKLFGGTSGNVTLTPAGVAGSGVSLTLPATTGTLALTSQLTPSGVGLGSVTNDAQTRAAIVPNTAPSAGQVLAGNAGGTAYAPVSVSGDASLASTGALTLSTVNSNVGTYGNATQTPAVTVNAKGLVTAVSNVTVTPAVGSITGLGTNVATALGTNVGSAGAFVVNGGALGTPSSGTLTNATGLPISTGVSGLGTNVATALGVNVGSAGAVVVNGGALGTPSSGTLTNATGLPISTGVSGLGTGIAAALAVNTGSAGAPVLLNGAGGTPSSLTLTNATGLPTAGLNDGAVTLAKMANLAQDQFIGRTTASTGVPQTATITAAARTVLDDTTVGDMVNTLGGATATGTGGLVRIGSPSFTGNITLPSDAAPSTTTSGTMAFDNNAWAASRGSVQLYDGTANVVLLGALASDTPSNGQVPVWNTGGTITWENQGSGMGGNYTVTGNTVASSGNVTLTSGTNFDINLTPGGTGNVVISNATVGNMTATSFSPTAFTGATANGQLFIGNATNGNFAKAVPTGTNGITVTAGASTLSFDFITPGTSGNVLTSNGTAWTSAAPSGGGNVTAASTFAADNRLVRSDGTSRGIQGSNIVIDDSDNISAVGSISLAGVTTYTANAMGALSIDTTKGLNTKTISANSTFTFSATPASNTYFSLFVTNSDGTEKTLTIPSSYSIAQASTITTVVIPGSGRLHLTWRYDGSGYVVYGDPVAAGGADQNIFQNIVVATQNTVTANSTTGNLTLVAGSGITITTDNTTNSVTFASSAGGGNISGSVTANRVIIGAGTNDIEALASGGNSGAPLLSAGTGKPAFGALDLAGGSNIVTGTLPAANLPNAADDGATKGVASFTAADFNASSGVISLDYTNGQAASGSNKGFLTSADWTTFNGKQAGSANLTTFSGIAPGTGVADALAVNVGSAGAFVVNGGALGTPSSGTVTNLTGTASININGTVGATTPSTGAFTTLSATGNTTIEGASIITAGSMGSATIDVTKQNQIRTLSGNETFQVSATPGDETWFSVVYLGDGTARTITAGTGTFYDVVNGATLTTFTVPINGYVHATFRYNSGNTTYYVYGLPSTSTGSGDASTNTSSSVDSEIALFSGTGGKTIKRATTTGVLKASSGVIAAAVSGTDYAPATSGTSILKGNGSGGFSSAVSSTDYAPATSGSALLKGNGSGGFSSAVADTDYVAPGGNIGAGTATTPSANDNDTSIATTAYVQSELTAYASDTVTLTNKRVTPRTGTVASSATPTINTDNVDLFTITALTADVTNFTTNLSGAPTAGQKLTLRILASGANRSLTWGASFASRGVTLPTTAVNGKYLYVGLIWNDATTTWDCIAVASEV